MTDANPLAPLAAWLRPVAANLTAETLGRRKMAVEEAAAQVRPIDDLVLAAHGELSDGVSAALEEILSATDDTFAADGTKDLLVSIIAAGACLLLLPQPSIEARQVALLTQSARFLGLKPVVSDLEPVAMATYVRYSRQSRQRVAVKTTPAAVKKALEQDLANGSSSAITAVAKRLEEVVAQLEQRVGYMDEEIDVLWWSRRQFSRIANAPWTTLTVLDRSIASALEVTQLVTSQPVTQGTLEVLAEVVDAQPEDMSTLVEIAAVLARLSPTPSTTRSRLLPLHSVASIVNQYGDGNVTVIDVAKTTLLLDAQMTIDVDRVAEQILLEISIQVGRS
jgi:hypothetical protein